MSTPPNPYLVIMAGGSGTRFWPKSTSRKPKQLLSFFPGTPTLLAQTLSRFDGVVSPSQRMIVTTEKLREAVEGQTDAEILGEPQGRNTAPCVYWAAREIARHDPKAVMLIMPSDHYIAEEKKFRDTIRAAIDRASKNDELVTLGIKPSRPETGYGYLRTGDALGGGCSRVEAFVEKPNLEKARQFVEAGNYLWNGGMFVWRVEVILKAFDAFMPEMKKEWDACGGEVEKAYPKLTATSIDYGVMEKARNVVTFALDCGWDDLGSWTSLESLADVLNARSGGGVLTGGDLISIESAGNIIDAPDRLVALLGVRDLVIVEHGGALLVADKKRAQDIRLVVEQIKKTRPEMA